jgi:hypothetical protein
VCRCAGIRTNQLTQEGREPQFWNEPHELRSLDHAFEILPQLSVLQEEHIAEKKSWNLNVFFSKLPRALLFKYTCLSEKKEREKRWEIIHGYQLNFRNKASP